MEDKLFIDQWHITADVEPADGDELFFSTKDGVMAGSFDSDADMFYMGDFYGYPKDQVDSWMYISPNRNYSTYPADGTRIAFTSKHYNVFMTGTYFEHLGKVGGVLLDDIYDFEDEEFPVTEVVMDEVYCWLPVPQLGEEGDYSKETSDWGLEDPYEKECEDLCVEDDDVAFVGFGIAEIDNLCGFDEDDEIFESIENTLPSELEASHPGEVKPTSHSKFIAFPGADSDEGLIDEDSLGGEPNRYPKLDKYDIGDIEDIVAGEFALGTEEEIEY